MYRVLIVDDERLVRKGLEAKINRSCENVEVAGEAKNGCEALELFKKLQPDFIITDIKMPVMSGIELIKQLREQSDSVEFIIISGYADFEFAKEAIFYGVTDYILKPVENESLKKSIKKITGKIEEKRQQEKINYEHNGLIHKQGIMKMERALNDILFSMSAGLSNTADINMFNEFDYRIFMLAIIHLEMKKLDCYEDFVDFNNMKDWAKSRIIHIINEEKKTYLFDNLKDNTEFMVLYGGENINQVEELSEKTLRRIQSAIADFNRLCVTIAKSKTVEDIRRIPVLYRQAATALDQRYKFGSNHIYSYNETENVKSDEKEDTRLLRSLEASLNQMSIVKIKYGVKEVLQQVFSIDCLAVKSKDEIQLLFNRVMNEFIKFSTRLGVDLIESLGLEVISGEIVSRFNRNEEFIDFFLKLMDEIIKSQNNSALDSKSLVQIIKKYIENNFNRDLTLNDTAKQFGISPKYCSVLFKKEVGMNFIDYLNHTRIEEAKNMLKKVNIDIQYISEHIGYNNIHYFYRIFKSKTGATPNEYRKIYTSV